MKSAIKFQTGQFIAGLRKLRGEVKKRYRRAVIACGADWVTEAKKRAPQHDGHLTESGDKRVINLSDTRWRVLVFFNIAYAAVMHESQYQLGTRSLEKQQEMGVVVGRKYLTRAATEDNRAAKWLKYVRDEIKKIRIRG